MDKEDCGSAPRAPTTLKWTLVSGNGHQISTINITKKNAGAFVDPNHRSSTSNCKSSAIKKKET